MSWVRIHDGAMASLKIIRLSNSAFRLWIKGLCYCQQNLTDGVIPREALHGLEAKRADVDMLCLVLVEGKSSLWERIPPDFLVHDYLDFNDAKAQVELKRAEARRRTADARARHALRSPYVTESSRANVPLGLGRKKDLQEEERAREILHTRAGELIEHYQDLYSKHRNGAKLRIIGNSVEFEEAVSLCRLWDDAHLEKLATLVLKADEPFIAGTDRSFKIFALKASWADDKLKAWELEHGVKS